MTTDYNPPPNRPSRLPENRKQGGRAVMLWLLIIVVFIAFFQIFGDGKHGGRTPADEAPEQRKDDGPPFVAWPFLIPLATMLGVGAVFVRLRSRLPAKYRTGALIIEEVPVASPSPAPPAETPPEPVEMKGRSSGQDVQLRIDDGGLHWTSRASTFKEEQWLEVTWPELKSFTVARAPGKSPTFILWLMVVAIFVVFFQYFSTEASGLKLFALCIPIFVVVVFFASRESGKATLTFMTDGHSVQVEDVALDQTGRERVEAAVKARRPDLFPSPSPANNKKKAKGFTLLLALIGMEQLRTLLKSDERLQADLGTTSPTTDPEEVRAGNLQMRLFSLWQFALMGAWPFSMLLAGVIALPWTSALVCLGGAWFVGIVAVAKTQMWIARMIGLKVLQPTPQQDPQPSASA